MAYIRTLGNERNIAFPNRSDYLGNLSWMDIPGDSNKHGHRYLTSEAIGDGKIRFVVDGKPIVRELKAIEKEQIIQGNLNVDDLTKILIPEEQKRHALRSTFIQTQPAAFNDIVASLWQQHEAILKERYPINKLHRIGQVLHLIQDSFCPAHINRQQDAGWIIKYIRNWSPVVRDSPFEHLVPIDPRDQVILEPKAASKAIHASRIYLQIIFKAIYGKINSNPGILRETAKQFNAFIQAFFRRS